MQPSLAHFECDDPGLDPISLRASLRWTEKSIRSRNGFFRSIATRPTSGPFLGACDWSVGCLPPSEGSGSGWADLEQIHLRR